MTSSYAITPLTSLVTPTQVLEIVFGLVFLVWFIYTLVVIYHWIRYAGKSWLVAPAITAHVVISIALFIMAASGFHYGALSSGFGITL